MRRICLALPTTRAYAVEHVDAAVHRPALGSSDPSGHPEHGVPPVELAAAEAVIG
ncbi:hypothetical protein ABT093_34550 [Kitasatospora sp. NPDC002551]|uniref:hypothetical protein n=1 Tax=Kitasatospora sp. NPDC002551 TaxID=3154539 RepID=UPI003327E985